MKIVLKDRNSLFIMLLLPMIIISVAGFALDFEEGIGIDVLVVDLDNGKAARDFVEFLEGVDVLNVDMESNEFAARDKVKVEGIDLIIIPRGFTEALLQGKESELQLIVDPTQEDENTVVQKIAEGYANRLATSVIAVKTVAAYGVPVQDEEHVLKVVEVADQFADPSPVRVTTESVSAAAATEFTTFTQYVPGFAVMFLLFSTIQAGAVSLLIEQESGTLRRLVIAPLSKADIIGGKIASSFIKGFLQLAVLLAFGHLVFSLNLGSDLLALLILMAAISFASTALGLLIAVLVRTKDQADSVAQFIVLTMSAIGGSWWPLFIEPQFMQDMAHLTITAWAMDGFYNLFFYDLGLPGILKEVGMLLLMAVLFFIMAISRFRFE
ncbi:MAG TPA: ABC transporter permease [Methanosarcina sp.]|nr:ABC transporter permease [Methanosarcina sp.]